MSDDTPRIGRSGPPAGLVMPLPRISRALLTRPALDADTRKVVSIFDRADRGQTCDLADLVEDCRLLDSRLDAVARKRVLAVVGRPLLVKPAPGWETDREAKAHAEEAQRLVERSPGFKAGLAHLAHATLDMPRVCEMEFTVTREGRYMPVLHRRHPNRFAYDADVCLGWLSGPGIYSSLHPLSDYPDRFVTHAPSGGRSSYPWRQGAMLARLVPSIAKRAGVRWYLQYLERYGTPLTVAELPQNEGGDEGSDTSLIAKAKQLIRDLQTDFAGVLSGGIKLTAVPGSGSAQTSSHQAFVDMMNTEDAIAILGQNLTTEVTGGSFAAAEAHRFVADDILVADLIELSETLTQQVLEPLARYNWPGGPPLEIEIVATRAQVFTAEDVRDGICTPDERRATLGHIAQPDGRGSQYALPSTQVADAVGADAPVLDVGAAETVQDTALNGAQVASMQAIVAAAAAGEIPISAAKVMIGQAFPSIAQADIAAMFADVVAAPPGPITGGAAAAAPEEASPRPPFPPTAPTTSAASATGGRSMHPLRRVLSER